MTINCGRREYQATNIYKRRPDTTKMTKEVTASMVDLAPHDNNPSLISITFNIETIRNKHPITEEIAVMSIPVLKSLRLT